MKEQDFIQKICGYAISDMKENGILASVTIAQAILESSWGTSELAKKANNYFGMKCSLSSNSWGSVWDRVSKYTKVTNEQDEAGKIYTIKADFRAYPDIEMSIKDHSMYLVGAMNGTEHIYCGIANEKDYRKAVEIIKAGGYATDLNYVSKICSIIEKYELTQYDEMEELNMGIEIRKQIATNSPCNKTGDEITVKGSMLHSVGCPQPKPEVFAKIWETSTGACVHAVTGADAYAIQCLPLFPERKKARRGWHGASGKNGSVNNTHLSLEMTEPATIKYVGGATWIETGDGSNTKRHVLATYANAVQVFAKWCKEFGLNPLEDGVIISHHEGNQRGIASNHGDVEHIWNKFGLTMDQFREDVKKAMGGQTIDTVPDAPVDNSSDDTSSQAVNPLSGSVKIIYTGDDGLNVRKAPCILDKYVDHVEHAGTFTVVGISADEKWYKLKSGLFITTIPEYVSFKATPEQKQQTAGTGYYRVRKNWDDADSQIGAFKNQNNAIELCKQNSGYKVFDNDGNEIYPCIKDDGTPFKFRVTIPDLRIRKGPGTTYDYWKKNGSPEYTGKNVFTIIDTAEGPGAKVWGLLKSGEKDRDRWISLDEDYGNRL